MWLRRNQVVEAVSTSLRNMQKWAGENIGRWIPGIAPAEEQVAEISEESAIAGLRSEYPRDRWESAAALGRKPGRGPQSIAALLEALTDPEPFVRWQASEALAAQDAGRVFPTLAVALADGSPLRRASVAETLGRLGGEAACAALRRSLADPVAAVRAAAARALGVCRDQAAVGLILPLLHDVDPEVQCAAAGALGQIGNIEAAGPLAEALLTPGRGLLVRRALAAALVRTPHPVVQPFLLEALSDPDPQVRGYAAEALGQAGNETALPALTEMQQDPGRLLEGTVGDVARRAAGLLERRMRRAPTAPQPEAG